MMGETKKQIPEWVLTGGVLALCGSEGHGGQETGVFTLAALHSPGWERSCRSQP